MQYRTRLSNLPAITLRKLSALCIGFGLLSGLSLHAAFEIADVTEAWVNGFRGYTKVYIDYGDNPISAAEWETFNPPPGYLKNTPRNGEFNDEVTMSSPGMPAPEVLVEEIGGYSWKFIAQIQSAMWPFNQTLFPDASNPFQAAFIETTPPEGVVKFSSNEKNQEMIFWATEGNDPNGAPILRYFVEDEWGNQYIMGAAGVDNDADIFERFQETVLPEGWTKSWGYLEQTLSLMPAYGAGDQAHYNLFRESGDNTFFQFVWGESGNGIAQQIQGMPIWGGQTDDIIRGRAGDDNLIHGAQGNDRIFALGNNDTIYGDDGIDTVILKGSASDYLIVSYANNGSEIVLFGEGFQKSIFDTEFIQFDDMTWETALPTLELQAAALNAYHQYAQLAEEYYLTNIGTHPEDALYYYYVYMGIAAHQYYTILGQRALGEFYYYDGIAQGMLWGYGDVSAYYAYEAQATYAYYVGTDPNLANYYGYLNTASSWYYGYMSYYEATGDAAYQQAAIDLYNYYMSLANLYI